MQSTNAGIKRRWLASAGGSLVLGGAVLFLFRAPPRQQPDPAAATNLNFRLTLGSEEDLAMRDLKPLFLPTKYNAAPRENPSLRRKADLFDSDAEKIAADKPALQRPPLAAPPETPADALRDTPGPLAEGLGRNDVTLEPRRASGGHLDVFASDGVDSILAVDLPPAARPTSGASGASAWRPLEYMVVVGSMGQVGALVLIRSSGVEEVDTHFRNYLAHAFRVGDRLPPGCYRIVVGP